MKRDIKILINKSEITAGTRGAALGPEAVMTAARKNGSMLFGQYPIQYIPHQNHLLDEVVKYSFAKRIEGLVQVFQDISDATQETIANQQFPLVLASDHGSAGGTIAGIKAAYPNKRLGVVWIDAHGDLHTPYTTPSGNMHGMPLATALNEDNIESKKNEIGAKEVELWDKLKNTGIPGAKLNPKDLVFIAVRDTEKEENELMDRLNIVNHTVDSIRSTGKEKILKKIEEQLQHCEIIYVSFDVDSMDPEHTSHGTGTPVYHGLTPAEAEFFLNELANWDKTACIEFVEVNPCLDEKTNKMAEITYELFESVTKVLKQ